jgi:outer membrane protein insertion porin family
MRSITRRPELRGVLAAALLMAAAFVSMAGLASQAAAAVASRIIVEGNQHVDAETVRAYVLVQPGHDYSAQDLDDSVKALVETGLFSDVRINQRGGDLVVTVTENPVINEVAFEGNKKFKDDQLAPLVESKPRGVFTRTKVQRDVQHILELYRRQGRYEASVTPKTIDLPNGRVNLVFEVAEGPKTGVRGITFIGNQAYGDSRLRGVIETRRTGLLSFLKSGDTYDPDRLSSDEDKLRRFYLNRGYADFQVVSSVADLDRERNSFYITFTLNEGPRYRFGHIAVDSSIPGVDTVALQRLASTREGSYYSSADVDSSVEAMTLRLSASGYPFAQVKARVERDPSNLTIGVTYTVDEAARVYVERIDVRGNSRTRDYVVRREFDLAEGDAYNRVLIDRATRRLKNLGYFSDVRITTEPGSSPDRVVVVVNVVEQATGEFSFGAGYSTADGVIGDVSLTERNFLGRGYNLRVAVGAGSSTRTYELAFTDPYFLGRRISAGFDIYRREYDHNDFRSYDYQTTGGGLTLGFPITDDFTVQLGYNIEQQEIQVPNFVQQCDYGVVGADLSNNVSRAICESEGQSLVSSVLYSLIYNSLDDYKDPHHGIYAKFTQEFAGVGGDVSFLRTTGSATYYHDLLPDRDVVGLVKVQGGDIIGIGDNVRLLDAFFKGGETVRGFESSGFGPRDPTTGDALGGNIFVAATAEMQFPIPILPKELGFKGAVFADAGTLFDTDFNDLIDENGNRVAPLDDAGIRSSVGGSIIWNSPLGLIRADFAYALTSEKYDREQVFRIGGGTKF